MTDQYAGPTRSLSRRTILRWELIGFLFLFLVGSLWHFFFNWSGSSTIIGIIAPVNESPWEHFKLTLYPGLLWALVQAPFLAKGLSNFLVAKATMILVAVVLVGLLFYGYMALMRTDSLFLDILIFALGTAAGQFASYRLLIRPPMSLNWRWTAAIVLVLLVVLFTIFTFAPPHWHLFQDSRSGTYGIPPG